MLASVKAEQYHRRLISGEGRVRKPLPPTVGPRCCMKMLRLTVLLATLSLGAGCSIDLTCEEPEAYQFAEPGKKVTAPDDLDQLETAREQPIPKASPQDPRPPGSPCLDLPPTLQSSGATGGDSDG